MDGTGSAPVVIIAEEPSVGTTVAGWSSRVGFSLPPRPWDLSEQRWICTGAVDDDAMHGGP